MYRWCWNGVTWIVSTGYYWWIQLPNSNLNIEVRALQKDLSGRGWGRGWGLVEWSWGLRIGDKGWWMGRACVSSLFCNWRGTVSVFVSVCTFVIWGRALILQHRFSFGVWARWRTWVYSKQGGWRWRSKEGTDLLLFPNDICAKKMLLF